MHLLSWKKTEYLLYRKNYAQYSYGDNSMGIKSLYKTPVRTADIIDFKKFHLQGNNNFLLKLSSWMKKIMLQGLKHSHIFVGIKFDNDIG